VSYSGNFWLALVLLPVLSGYEIPRKAVTRRQSWKKTVLLSHFWEFEEL
jgi:hypothetical protein